ncbi:NACHT and WD40-domain containing NOD-like receptor 2 [Podospora pseudoanserina]|uniref:NACHT and WD40-domain containing NOD-like receptor 2 n=1 Tax=Podospora pseudoanserina TaxID=2609844 RepID=A0ABR0IBX6_9PEZI|nr:NACHT and WD40-domain containing NOD-like receptor 2 [Podospora pseudoanserina]
MANQVRSIHAEGQARVHVGNSYYGSSDFLPTADDAAFDSHAEEHNARCHRDTRTELLRQIREWADNPHGKTIFWLNGMAGTGKSTISRTVAKSFADDGILGASFFFKRGEGDRGKATLFFPTIASQLVRKIPALEAFVREAIDNNPDVARKALRDQFEKLILQPLDRIHHAIAVIVVDALDECDGDNDVKVIISLLSQAKELRSPGLRIFITSRPELPIRLGFKNVTGEYQDLALHQIPEPIVEHDISAFLRHELGRIRDDYNHQALECIELLPDWPGEHAIRTLAQMAVPLFIFAATVCRFIEDPAWSDPADQLEKVLQYQMKAYDSELGKLDATYLPVLKQITIGHTNPQKLLAAFRDVVGPIVLLAQPLSVLSLAKLLNFSPKSIYGRLNSLHSVLSVPSSDSPVRLFHLSFRDFLVDPTKRAAEFWIDETKYHKTLADRCIQLLHQHLRRDICGLQVPGKLRSEIDQRTIDAVLPPETQYACQYWVHHLKEGKSTVQDGGPVHSFLTSHLLHWLEALSLLGRISESISMVDDLLTFLHPTSATEVSAFLCDLKRFILNSQSIIDIAPLQIYASALVFSPARSITRGIFKQEERKWITSGPIVEDSWNACRQTLEGHSDSVYSVAFSPDSKWIASGSEDCTIKIWHLETGSCQQTLEGHSSWVRSVVFSPDSKWIASGSGDCTVKIWDLETGSCQQTLEGYSSWVYSVVFSPDSKWIASGSDDRTIKIWDLETGSYQQTLEGHSSSVYSVVFSPDSKWIASGSVDPTIKIWDLETGSCQQTLEGHSSSVRSVVFSPDSKWIASGSEDRTIKIWDLETGSYQQALEGHSSSVSSVAFSPDSKWIALGLADRTIKIWDLETGLYQQTLEGHSSSVCWVASSLNSVFIAFRSDNANAPHYEHYGISSDNRWITRASKNWLWLPTEYRPNCSAVAASRIAIGCASRGVLIIIFPADNV